VSPANKTHPKTTCNTAKLFTSLFPCANLVLLFLARIDIDLEVLPGVKTLFLVF